MAVLDGPARRDHGGTARQPPAGGQRPVSGCAFFGDQPFWGGRVAASASADAGARGKPTAERLASAYSRKRVTNKRCARTPPPWERPFEPREDGIAHAVEVVNRCELASVMLRRKSLRWVLVIGAAMVVLASIGGAGGVGWLWLQHDKTVILPAPAGPYAVGRTEFEWTDTARQRHPFRRVQPATRVTIWIWYPAAPASGAAPAPYCQPPGGALASPRSLPCRSSRRFGQGSVARAGRSAAGRQPVSLPSL